MREKGPWLTSEKQCSAHTEATNWRSLQSEQKQGMLSFNSRLTPGHPARRECRRQWHPPRPHQERSNTNCAHGLSHGQAAWAVHLVVWPRPCPAAPLLTSPIPLALNLRRIQLPSLTRGGGLPGAGTRDRDRGEYFVSIPHTERHCNFAEGLTRPPQMPIIPPHEQANQRERPMTSIACDENNAFAKIRAVREQSV